MITVPKEHRDAVGLANYEALGATSPWERVNGTGTVIALLLTSAEAADDKKDLRLLGEMFKEWGVAMHDYSNKEDDSQKYHAAWKCVEILGKLGLLAYKYGNIPSGGFKKLPPGGPS